MKKKLLSCFLCIALLVSIMPINYGMTAKATTASDFTAVIVNNQVKIISYSGSDEVVVVPSQISGYPVTTIGDEAFFNCDTIKEIVLPDTVSKLGYQAFGSCDNLLKINIPDGVTVIPDKAFYFCYRLTSLTMPDSVGRIGSYAFYHCRDLENIVFSKNILQIDVGAFTLCGYDLQVYNNCYYAENYLIDCDDSYSGEIVIRNGTQVVASQAFYGSEATSIVIPADIGSVALDAFLYCPNLEKFVTEEGCKNLYAIDGVLFVGTGTELLAYPAAKADKTYTIPYGIENICKGAFSYSKVECVNIPNSVTYISDNVFENCENLLEVNIPESVTTIGSMAFSFCCRLSEITLPSNLKYLGESVFAMSGISSITIPAGIKKVPKRTFDGCTGLKSVTIEQGIETIGENAFAGCYELGSVDFPSSVKTIETYAFWGCDYYTPELPENIETIGDYAFSAGFWGGLAIPNSIKTIGKGAFSGYGGEYAMLPHYCGTAEEWEKVTVGDENDELLKYIHFNDNLSEANCVSPVTCQYENCNYTSNEPLGHIGGENTCTKGAVCERCGVTYGKALGHTGGVATCDYKAVCERCNEKYGEALGHDYAYNDDSWVEVCSKCNKAREYWYNIDSGKVTLQYYVGSDTDVVIPDTIEGYPVTYISGTFRENTNITSVTIPNGVKSISDGAFNGCENLKSIYISDTVESISGFGDYDAAIFGGCTNLQNVYITSLEAWCNINFDWISYDNPLMYAENLYLNGELLTDLVIPDTVKGIGMGAFSGYKKLISVTMPDSVTSIGDYAFEYCENLEEVTFGKNVRYISISAFYGCSSLKQIILPDSVKSISDSAFCGCSTLENVVIPSSVEYIEYNAFSSCRQLKNIHFSGTEEQWNALDEWGMLLEDKKDVLHFGDNLTESSTCISPIKCLYDGCIYTEGEVGEHKPTDDWVIIRKPTAFEEGLKQKLCTGCCEVLLEEVIAKLTYDADINGDGNINASDLLDLQTNILDALFSISDYTYNAVYDMNGDGKLDLKDLVRLKKYLAGFDVQIGC